MLSNFSKITLIASSVLGLQACESDENDPNTGYVLIDRATNQAITAAEETRTGKSVYFSAQANTLSQVWKVLEAEPNANQLQNVATGKCLTLSLEMTLPPATTLKLADCEKTPLQYWSISPKDGDTYTISLKGSGAYLSRNSLCYENQDIHGGMHDSVDGDLGCNSIVTDSSSEASSFAIIDVVIDDDPGGDDGTPPDNDPDGDDGTPTDEDLSGDNGTFPDIDPGGDDDGTSSDDSGHCDPGYQGDPADCVRV